MKGFCTLCGTLVERGDLIQALLDELKKRYPKREIVISSQFKMETLCENCGKMREGWN